MDNSTVRLFVYGTLKSGFPNFGHNTGNCISGTFQTVNAYPLYLVGERYSPWLLDQPGHGSQVEGEVFELNNASLEKMDLLERTHAVDGYRRKTIVVLHVESGTESSVYVYMKPPEMLKPADIREGPLSCYTHDHGELYVSRRQLT